MSSTQIRLLLTSHLSPPSSLQGEEIRDYLFRLLGADAHPPEHVDLLSLRRSSALLLDPESAQDTPDVQKHLAQAWGLQLDRIQHVLLKVNGEDHWYWIKDKSDWESWVATLLVTTPDAQLARKVLGPDATPLSQQDQTSYQDPPSPTLPDSAPDPEEQVPYSIPTSNSTGTNNRIRDIEQIFDLGSSIASSVIGSLSNLARNISSEAEAMRAQHGAFRSQSSNRPLFAPREQEELDSGVQDANEPLHQGLYRVLATMRQATSQEPCEAEAEASSAADDVPPPAEASSAPPPTSEVDELHDELAREYEMVLLDADRPSDAEDPTDSQQSSPRRRRRRSGNGCLLSTLGMLATMMLFLFPVLIGATPLDASLSTGNDHRVRSLNPPTGDFDRRSTSVQHVCKCTCFSTNSTLVPIYAPQDPTKPCSTCTRQFCIDQNLDICKDAKLGKADGDTATGWEGDVWAKCFERDSYKDQSIITLYLLVVVGLVAFAALRGRMGGWYEEYRSMGPRGLYDAVASAPWMRR